MSDLGDAIRKARKAKGLTLEALAGIISTDAGNLSRLERGVQGGSQELLTKVFQALGVSLSGTIGAGMMRGNIENTGIPSSAVPVLSSRQIKQWIDDMPDFKHDDASAWVLCPVACGPRTFVLRVTGESMQNLTGKTSFRAGDFIYCDPDREILENSFVLVRGTPDADPQLRQLVIDSGARYIKAINPAWPDQIKELASPAEIVAVVIFKGESLI
jgi:SOS-response transcriptional repressor LexA